MPTPTKYFYEGMTLKDFCANNDLNYRTQLTQISKYHRLYPNLNSDDLVKLVMSKCGTKEVLYYYEGMTLHEYCRLHQINYNNFMINFYRLREKKPELANEEIITMLLQKNNSKAPVMYEGILLEEYCQSHNLNIRYVKERWHHLQNKGEKSEEALKNAIQYYERKNQDNKIAWCFTKLKSDFTESELKEIINYLNIDVNNFYLYANFLGSFYKAITFIWYFHDNQDGKLKVSQAKYLTISWTIKKLVNHEDIDLNKLSIPFLIGLYKSQIYDTRYLIYLKLLHYYEYYINSSYHTDIDTELILEEAMIFTSELIEKMNSNQDGAMISYLTKSLKWFIKGKIKDAYKLKEEADKVLQRKK